MTKVGGGRKHLRNNKLLLKTRKKDDYTSFFQARFARNHIFAIIMLFQGFCFKIYAFCHQ